MYKWISLIGLLGLSVTAAQALEIRGYISAEQRAFTQSAQFDTQSKYQSSLAAKPEFYWELEDGENSFIFTPFLRLDSQDQQRSHWDIRELKWLHLADDWELEAGTAIVFWGVTESQHLVDVINQTDNVEGVNGDEKLGQPMLHLTLLRDWGSLEGFVLPGFRERTFAGVDGRLRPALPVDTDNAQYQSSQEWKHVDYALRWSHTLGDWDIGVSAFNGTNRDPYLLPNSTGDKLVPYYDQMTQISTDVQATIGEWLWKLEALHRNASREDHSAAVGGFEYTLIGILDTDMDLGLLSEYNWDERGDSAPTPYQNDLFAAARLVFNDVDGTEILAGVARDLDHMSYSGRLEATTRIGDNWRLNVDAWVFNSSRVTDPIYSLRKDDMITVSLDYFF